MECDRLVDIAWHAALCQGSLDIRYLTQRYEKGKEWVRTFMDAKQKFHVLPLPNAHADLLSDQRDVAGRPMLLGRGVVCI